MGRRTAFVGHFRHRLSRRFCDQTSNFETLIEFKPRPLIAGTPMADSRNEQIREIESTQQELRQSLERSRELVEETRAKLERLRNETTEH